MSSMITHVTLMFHAESQVMMYEFYVTFADVNVCLISQELDTAIDWNNSSAKVKQLQIINPSVCCYINVFLLLSYHQSRYYINRQIRLTHALNRQYQFMSILHVVGSNTISDKETNLWPKRSNFLNYLSTHLTLAIKTDRPNPALVPYHFWLP